MFHNLAILGLCLMLVGGEASRHDTEPEETDRLGSHCESVLGAQPGLSVHEVVARLGSPIRVFLGGEDPEFSAPKATDNLFLVFDREVVLSRGYKVSVSAIIEHGGCTVTAVTGNFGNPMDTRFRGVAPDEVRAQFGEPARVFRRGIDMRGEGPEAPIGNCEDPAGVIESWLYPDLCLEVQFYRTNDRKDGYFMRVDPRIATEKVLPRCAEHN